MGSKVGLIVLVVAVALFGYGLYRTWGPAADAGANGKTGAVGGNASGTVGAKSAANKSAPTKAKTPDDDDPTPRVRLTTTHGEIVVELNRAKAPITVANFLEYVEADFYQGTIFHRVKKGTMIQGGSFTPGLQQKKTREPIRNEARNRVKNRRGTIAMARGAGVDTATAQFFINTRDNRDFDHKGIEPRKFGYAVFGKVIEGMEVVKVIENIKTTKRNGMRNVPSVPVVIKTVRLVDGVGP